MSCKYILGNKEYTEQEILSYISDNKKAIKKEKEIEKVDNIYINKDTADDSVLLHEFNHLYNNWLKQNRPEVYKKGLDLVKAEVEKTAKVSFSKQSIDNENKDFIQDFSIASVKGKEYQFLKAGNVFYVEVDGVGEVAKATLNKDGYLDNIRVDENYRRKGIGNALYDYIENISGNTIKTTHIKI